METSKSLCSAVAPAAIVAAAALLGQEGFPENPRGVRSNSIFGTDRLNPIGRA